MIYNVILIAQFIHWLMQAMSCAPYAWNVEWLHSFDTWNIVEKPLKCWIHSEERVLSDLSHTPAYLLIQKTCARFLSSNYSVLVSNSILVLLSNAYSWITQQDLCLPATFEWKHSMSGDYGYSLIVILKMAIIDDPRRSDDCCRKLAKVKKII